MGEFTVQIILAIIGGSTVISSIIIKLLDHFLARKNKEYDKDDEITKKIKLIEVSIEELKQEHAKTARAIKEHDNLIGAVDSIMVVLSSALRALLRDKIIDKYNYHVSNGYMPLHDKDSLNNMITEYKNLGGNGVLNNIVEELYDLPMSK